jgi:hypothetical protein
VISANAGANATAAAAATVSSMLRILARSASTG